MRLILDANVLFAALIKREVTLDLMYNLQLYAPDLILNETLKYKDYIIEKSGKPIYNFDKFLNLLLKYITLFPFSDFREFIDQAEKISPDPDDVSYFALALRLNCPIWSNDKKLKNQDIVKIYSTEDLIKLFNK